MTKNLIYWYKEEDVFEALRERILTKEVQELFDNTVKTKEDLEYITGVKMLSAIPVGEGKK